MFLKAIEIEWVAWRFNQKNSMLGAESILQIQSNSWFTCAQLLAGGLWWWFGNGFRLRYSCIQNRMRKHPWYRLTLPLRLSCFHSHQCQQFHNVSSMDTPTYYAIGPLHWASPVQPRGFSHQQVHYFCLVLLSCDIQGRIAWEPLLTFELTLSNINQTSDKGGGVVQRILIGKTQSIGCLQNSMHGTFFAATKYRTQPYLIRKLIQNMHYKNQCIWS